MKVVKKYQKYMYQYCDYIAMSLRPNGYRPRLIEKEIMDSLEAFGAVSIEGPKWCGKTWVGLNLSNSAYMMGDTNEYGTSNKDLAETNIKIALEGPTPRLIDEWQEIPRIWDVIRSEIDRNASIGLFLLTGSSTPKERRAVHSGTGRIRHMSIRTMSLYESGDSVGTVSLSNIMENKDIGISENKADLNILIESIIGGGWPGNIGLSIDVKKRRVDGYLDSIIEDASSMDGVRRKKEGLWSVIRSLARNESTLATNDRIHKDTGIPIGDIDAGDDSVPLVSYNTVMDYLDVFDRLHLIENQPAFDPNIRSSSRVRKAVKRHLTDPSLAVAALRIDKERLKNDLKTFGFLFESLCERDLQIYSKTIGGELFHYRDSRGEEIDAVIEMPDGRWGAFEIKLGGNQVDDAAKNLLRIGKKMNAEGNGPSVLCVICGLMDHAYRREDGVYVVPITSLRP